MAAGDVKIQHGSSAAFTITLASLATSSTRVAGRESTAVAISGLQPVVDILIGGKITVGTTPTTNTQIDVWVYGSLDDTPTYPDVGGGDGIGGSDSALTCATAGVRNSAMHLLVSMEVDSTTSDRVYAFAPRGIAKLFGGVLPKNIGIFVTHNTGVNLNSTGGNHVISYTPVYYNTAQS
jgi:hypothetical protein